MSIIEEFKRAGKPTNLDFFQSFSFDAENNHDISAACVYAARYNHIQLFDWAYDHVAPTNMVSVNKKSLIAASLSGHAFVLERTFKSNGITPSDIKKLYNNAAEKGHDGFIDSLIQKVGLSPENRIGVLISAARRGQCKILNKYAPLTPNNHVFSQLFYAAAQNGHLHVIQWLEANTHANALLSDENLFYKITHEAVANTHSTVLSYLLESEKWALARNAHGIRFQSQMVQELNTLLRVSQNPEKKHETIWVLVPYVPFEKWQKSQRYINPFINEYMSTIYIAHQKHVLQEAVREISISGPSRRKM